MLYRNLLHLLLKLSQIQVLILGLALRSQLRKLLKELQILLTLVTGAQDWQIFQSLRSSRVGQKERSKKSYLPA